MTLSEHLCCTHATAFLQTSFFYIDSLANFDCEISLTNKAAKTGEQKMVFY